MRKAVKWAVVAVGVPLLVIQFVRPERANPPFDPAASIERRTHMPADVAAILDRSCKDCHSNETRWPWYSNVAPVSWLVVDDVTDGRRQVNFSEWASYTPDEANARLTYMLFAVRSGTMPKASYLRMHPAARLSAAEIDAIARWVESETK
jgi:heme-binding protein